MTTVTPGLRFSFLTARHQCPLTDAKLYCSVTEARVCKQLPPGCTWRCSSRDLNPGSVDRNAGTLTAQPLSCTITWVENTKRWLFLGFIVDVGCTSDIHRPYVHHMAIVMPDLCIHSQLQSIVNRYPIPYDILGGRGTCSVLTTFPVIG